MTSKGAPDVGIIVWTDIEACGLADDSPILEVAVIITSQRLTRIASSKWLIAPPAWSVIKERLDQPVLDMHTANGLIADIDALHASNTAPSVEQVEGDIISFISQRNPGNGKVTLGGSGVAAYDMRLIKAQMPRLAGMLNYYTYDVGMLRRFGALVNLAAPAEHSDSGSKTHRADDDIEMHLAEAQWWLGLLREAKGAGLVGLSRPAGDEKVDDLMAALGEQWALSDGAGSFAGWLAERAS